MQKIHHAKKSLGQNFLKSEQALKKIIEEGEISPSDIILEIGPGKGVLTKKLLEKSNCVIAVEKDKNLVEFLQEKFTEEIKNKKIILVEDDCLEFNPKNYNLETRTYKLISNIPYNITGAILKKFLTEKSQPETMVLMVQNEVAKRIVGIKKNPSTLLRVKESILSISVKAYGTPKFVMKVPARYFSPAPKVDSAIISIKNISRKFFEENKIDEKNFWELIHTGFAHKRKKLSSNLKKIKENLNKEIFEQIKNKRAEDLTLANWLNLVKKD